MFWSPREHVLKWKLCQATATWCGTGIVNEKNEVLANGIWGLFITAAEASLS